MAVGAGDGDGVVGRYVVDELMIGQGGWGPAFMVPGAIFDPAAFGGGLGEFGDTATELGLAGGIGEMNADDLFAAPRDVDVGVVEAGEQEAAVEVYDFVRRKGQLEHGFGGADGEDFISTDGYGFCPLLGENAGPDCAVDED